MIKINRAGASTSRANIWLSKQTFSGVNNSSISSSLVEGDLWNDSVQKSLVEFLNGMQQSISTCIFTQTADKTVSNSVAETSIIGSGVGNLTLPSNFFVQGKSIRVRIGGTYSTAIATTPSVLVKVKLGSTVLSSVTTTGLLAGASNLEFDGEALITCRTTGVSGTYVIHGDIEYATGLAGTISVDPLNNAGSTGNIDTTISNLLDVTITWDSATPTRSVKSTITTVEIIN